jgi:hypothetical protein
MTKKQKTYIAIGASVLGVILFTLFFLAYRGSIEHSTAIAGAAATASVAAISAAQSRMAARAEVVVADTKVEEVKKELEVLKADDKKAVDEVKVEVADLSRDAKEKQGEELFKPGSGS